MVTRDVMRKRNETPRRRKRKIEIQNIESKERIRICKRKRMKEKAGQIEKDKATK